MVQISSIVALLAMGSSIMASPLVLSGDDSVAVNVANPVGVVPRDNTQDNDGKIPEGTQSQINASIDTSLARAGAGGRSGGGGGDMAAGIIEIASTVFKAVWHIHNDIERRKQFTQEVALNTAAQFPGHNVVVCNVGYSLKGDGWQQVTTVSYNAKIGHDVTYDVVVFNSPKTFERHGDGGFQNWAYVVGSHCHTNGGWIDCPAHPTHHH